MIIKCPVFLLLVVNVFLVLVGYVLAIFTAGSILPQVMVVKGFVLLVSLATIITFPYRIVRDSLNFYRPYAFFSACLLLSCLYAYKPQYSFVRTILCVAPLGYLYLTIYFLAKHFTVKILEKYWLITLLVIYSLPLINVLLVDNIFSITNLYYLHYSPYTKVGFVSNQYGWSSCLVMTSGIGLLFHLQSSTIRVRFFILVLISIAIFIVFISGNRTSLIVLGLVIVLLIVQGRLRSLGNKVLIFLISILWVFWLLNDPTSALNQRLNKTYTQLEIGESRLTRLLEAWQYATENWMVWIHGWGMFSPPEQLMDNLHNSYAEIFFGAGVPVFICFFYYFILRPIRLVVYEDSPLVWPLVAVLVIPFFESNLTVGQFLYYPWLGTIVLIQVKEHLK